MRRTRRTARCTWLRHDAAREHQRRNAKQENPQADDSHVDDRGSGTGSSQNIGIRASGDLDLRPRPHGAFDRRQAGHRVGWDGDVRVDRSTINICEDHTDISLHEHDLLVGHGSSW